MNMAALLNCKRRKFVIRNYPYWETDEEVLR